MSFEDRPFSFFPLKWIGVFSFPVKSCAFRIVSMLPSIGGDVEDCIEEDVIDDVEEP
jgi:hypothetical protein